MTRASKRKLWERRLAAWERSGLSRRAWCAAHGVGVNSLDYWRARLRGAPKGMARSGSRALVPIVVEDVKQVSPRDLPALLVMLPNGMQLQAPVATDARWLATVVRELGAC